MAKGKRKDRGANSMQLTVKRFHDSEGCAKFECSKYGLRQEYVRFEHLQRHTLKYHRDRKPSGQLDTTAEPEMPSKERGDRWKYVIWYSEDMSTSHPADPDNMPAENAWSEVGRA